MNINRHNYEEFFILYADNELSSDERRLVDEFVLANPDLKDEIDIYRNSILTADTSLNFENKESLLRYDESIISYIDNELPADEKAQLEKLIDSSPRLQQELNLYRQTKLQPDTEIVFENISVLYRSSEKRVVPMRMIRWAAAAVVLLAVSFSAIKYLNNKSGPVDIAEANPGEKQNPVTTKPEENSVAIDEKKNETLPADNNIQQTGIEKVDKKDNLAVVVPPKQKQVLSKDIKQQNIKAVDQKKSEAIAVTINQSPSNNLPTPQNNPYINKDKDAVIASNSGNKNQKIVNEAITDERDVTKSNSAPLYISNSTTIDTPVYSDDEDENKNKKSRGFFRKVTRFVEKNTGIKTTDDDKLRIAAFTVKLK